MSRNLLSALLLGCLIGSIVCPPVKHQPEEGGGENDDEHTGLEYDRYLKEVVMALEEDPLFKKKLEESNSSDIKSGAIAMHLDLVGHHIRQKLDEIKRREIDRLKDLYRQKMKTMNGVSGKDRSLDHVNVGNPASFEIKDLEKLILKATEDLEEIDKKRREEFKEYEMAKEHERREKLKQMDEAERKKAEAEYEAAQNKHKEHPKVHHPGSKDQLKEVWEEEDKLDPEDFDPKTFFKLHDIDGNGLLDETEVASLFQAELDKVYDPNASEDDMNERYEEMERMREHVVKELDVNKDKMISLREFMDYTNKEEFKADEGWETLDQQQIYSEDDLKEYEKMLMEEEARRQQFGGHAQPGVIMQQHPGNSVGEMNMPQGAPMQGFHPNAQNGLSPEHNAQMMQQQMHMAQQQQHQQMMQQQQHQQQMMQAHQQQQMAQQQHHEQMMQAQQQQPGHQIPQGQQNLQGQAQQLGGQQPVQQQPPQGQGQHQPLQGQGQQQPPQGQGQQPQQGQQPAAQASQHPPQGSPQQQQQPGQGQGQQQSKDDHQKPMV